MDAVQSPDGTYWSVGCRWKPSVGENPNSSPALTVRFAIVLVATYLVAFHGLRFAVQWVDPVYLYLVFGLELFRRVVLRHVWVVEAVADNGGWWQWRVVGFFEARAKRAEAVDMITSGEVPVPEPESSAADRPLLDL